MYNYYSLKQISYRKHHSYLLVLILILFLIICGKTDTYNTQNFSVKYLGDDLFSVNVPIKNSDSVKRGAFVKMNGMFYKYKIIDIGQADKNNTYTYNTYIISMKNTKSIVNEVNEITFYYDQQKMLKKIVKIII